MEGLGVYSMGGFFTFDSETMKDLSRYLFISFQISEEELRTLFDIENIEAFNFGDLNSLDTNDDSIIS